jgi:hypothetical protein
MGKAIAAPGTDLRWWYSEGTVSKLDPATGDLDYTDPRAIWNDSGGVHVDVELQPLGQHVTARYAGISAGEVTIFAPIRPGDIVLVALPDGSTVRPVIEKILHSRSNRQPTAGGKPIFDNNRLFIYAKSTPIDIRTAGGVQVLLDQNGNATVTASTAVKLGGSDSLHPTPQGDLQQTALNNLATALQAYIGAIKAIADPSGLATATMSGAISAFVAAQYLSTKVSNQ